ncbi:MAG: shikimate dehydrogenase [Rhizobiaceae bacterium]|nr:shikimate dehydrogenase [Rhizobiaceae bacterium]
MTDNNQSDSAFVIGWPIKHSRSPLVHGYWLKYLKIQGTYEAVAVVPENIDIFIKLLPKSGFAGGNVTVPHKETVYRLIDHPDEIAQALGAVNTLWLENGEIHGTNTDGYGFCANLDDFAPKWREGKTATILGAGGASRAVIYALGKAGYTNIHIINRTILRAQAIADEFSPLLETSLSAHGWEEATALLADTDLLVNTTSIGMDEDIEFPLDLANLKPNAIVTDIVYTPLLTPLLKLAKRKNFKTVDGLGMLLHQAAPGFEKWFGTRPNITPALRQYILSDLNKKATVK